MLGAHSPGREAGLQEVQGGHPGAGGCRETLPPLAGSTCTVPQGRGAEGRARRPEALALGRTGVAQDAGTKLPATLWVPNSRGPGRDLGASGPLRRAGRAAGHLRPPPREPVRPRAPRPAADSQRGISPAPSRPAPPAAPRPPGKGQPGVPASHPGSPGPTAPTHPRDMAARAGEAAERGARVAALGARLWGRRAGTGTEREGAEGEPHARGDFSPPRGRRRGREGRRRPRCVNPFGALGPPGGGPAGVTPFSEAEPEAPERAQPPGVARPERGWPSGDVARGYAVPPAELLRVAGASGRVGTRTPPTFNLPRVRGALPSGPIRTPGSGRQRRSGT